MDNFASWGGGIRGLFLATLTSFNFPGGASLTRLGPHMYSLYMGTKRSCNLEYLLPEISFWKIMFYSLAVFVVGWLICAMMLLFLFILGV